MLMALVTFVVMCLFNIPSIMNLLDGDFIEIIKSGRGAKYYSVILNEQSDSPLMNVISFITMLCAAIFGMAQIHVYLIMSRGPEPVSFSNFIEGFNLWRKAVLEGLWTALWTYLWTLLFIIPGIVKSIAYSQAFFLLAEYPNLSVPKALRVSIAMTRGYKGDLFIMYLSFIGWAFLSVLSCGIGFLWLEAYISMTEVNAYHWLLKRAIETHTITFEDLGVVPERDASAKADSTADSDSQDTDKPQN